MKYETHQKILKTIVSILALSITISLISLFINYNLPSKWSTSAMIQVGHLEVRFRPEIIYQLSYDEQLRITPNITPLEGINQLIVRINHPSFWKDLIPSNDEISHNILKNNFVITHRKGTNILEFKITTPNKELSKKLIENLTAKLLKQHQKILIPIIEAQKNIIQIDISKLHQIELEIKSVDLKSLSHNKKNEMTTINKVFLMKLKEEKNKLEGQIDLNRNILNEITPTQLQGKIFTNIISKNYSQIFILTFVLSLILQISAVFWYINLKSAYAKAND